ncbi:zinc finger protein CONSTANS-LIKE 3-like [Impatiens glandulifera]|uniref:zinc finger protein CONSTANS-LIKE 3-like n=1 Tax=Impatiens glandulifera TaxID=253017 RepID=UPI001FB0FDF6|nr:zinc finger protein CONSTANS-LIKE 3-like [Impatiens glandulifera]
MKICELCNAPARMYCDSDQAFICLDCDSRVHSANFLVAKHIRNLLCRVCQSSTPWKASGPSLGLIVSMCIRCVDGYDRMKVLRSGKQYEEEIQVVPLSSDQDQSQSQSPPAAASSSSCLDSSNRILKRMRGNHNNVDLTSDDDDDDDECCSSSLRGSSRALKVQRLESNES